MSVYWVAMYDIVDQAGYEEYLGGALPNLQKHGVEVLVADPEAKCMEGSPRQMAVVLRFESEEAAMTWYNDPEYAPWLKMRLAATDNGTALLAKEFQLPED